MEMIFHEIAYFRPLQNSHSLREDAQTVREHLSLCVRSGAQFYLYFPAHVALSGPLHSVCASIFAVEDVADFS